MTRPPTQKWHNISSQSRNPRGPEVFFYLARHELLSIEELPWQDRLSVKPPWHHSFPPHQWMNDPCGDVEVLVSDWNGQLEIIRAVDGTFISSGKCGNRAFYLYQGLFSPSPSPLFNCFGKDTSTICFLDISQISLLAFSAACSRLC